MDTTNNKANTKCTTALWHRYRTGQTPVITDIKCKSPGEGDLMFGRDPVELAVSLASAGAPVISVVTEEVHYGGSLQLLNNIAKATSVPILRKDFIKTRDQLLETADMGASAVLLISSMLEISQLYKLIEEAAVLGLEPLVETHNEAELKAIKDLPITFVGINNRNIIEWETDDGNVATTEGLADLAPKGAFVVSESSIMTPEDVKRATASGAHAVLVGTAILKAQNPLEMYRSLAIPWR